MRIVIVEDESLVAQRLQRMTSEILGTEATRIAVESTLEDASDRLFNQPSDLLILDLNLNGKDGFALLQHAVSGSFHTIVVSANTDRAMEAFEYGVLDFVGKPFTRERLEKALGRVRDFRTKAEFPTRYLSVRHGEKLALVEIDKIDYIRGAGNYSELHLKNGSIELHDKSLLKLEAVLPSSFIRTHKSYILNIQQISHFRSLGASRYEVQLSNGVHLPVSRNKYKEIKHLIP